MINNTIETPPDIVTYNWGRQINIKWPHFVMTNTPDPEWYPIKCIRKGQYVKFYSGDPRLLKEAGEFYNKLFRLQRKYQALNRKDAIKWYKREERRLDVKFTQWDLDGFYFCYPQKGWKEQGLRLKTELEVMKFPFQPLYTAKPMSEADLGIAPNGKAMDRRIWEFKKINREAPELPTIKREIDVLYKKTRYNLGIGGNVPRWKAKQYIHGHYYAPPGPYANVDTNLRHIDRFSAYNSSDSDGEITIED